MNTALTQNPRLLLYLFIVFLHPLLRGCWDIWAQSLILIVISCLIVTDILMLLARSPRINAQKFWQIFSETSLLLVLFLSFSFASLIQTRHPHSAIPTFLNDVAAVAFFYMLASVGQVQRNTFLKAISLTAVIVVVISFFITNPDIMNPNVLGAYIILTGPLIMFYAYQYAHNRPMRVIGGLIIIFTILSVFFTKSFAAYLLFIGQGLALWHYFKKQGNTQKTKHVSLFLWVMIIVALAGAWFFRHDWIRFFIKETDRWGWWLTALSMWKNNLFFGVGPGAFGEAYPGYRVIEWGVNTLYAHNFVLEILAERGLLGAGVLIGFFICLWKRARVQNPQKSSVIQTADTGLVLFPVKLGLIGFCLYNLMHVGFSFPSLWWIFWAMTGCLWGAARHEGENTPPTQNKTRTMLRIFLLSMGMLIMSAVGICSYRLMTADQFLSRSRTAIERQNIVLAETLLKQGIHFNPKEPEFYSLLAAVNGLHGRWEEAQQNMAQGIALSPYSARFQREAGEVFLRRGQPAQALRHYQKAAQYLPLNVFSWLRKAQIHAILNEKHKAVENYQKVLWLLDHPYVLVGKEQDRQALKKIAQRELSLLK